MRLGSMFTGAAGLDLGVASVLDMETVWHAENDPAAARVLAHRYPDVPNLGDVTAIDWAAVAPVDVLTGGFPCQDVSHAGRRGGMQRGVNRSGLWGAMATAIDQLRPELVVIENVRGLLSAAADSDVEPCPWCLGDDSGEPPMRALGAVLADLADLGYDAAWTGIRAADVGAPHGRFRVFVLAWPATDSADIGHERGRGAWDWRPGPADSDRFASDTECGELQRRRGPRDLGGPSTGAEGTRDQRQWDGDTPDDRGATAPDAEDRPEPVEPCSDDRQWPLDGTEPRAGDRDSAGNPAPRVPDLGRGAGVEWGPYRPAIEQWERVLGRVAPPPTETGAKGGQRLSPRFVEWMMGWPASWVTDVPGITRNDQLKICGNGVVPQQAAAALERLLSRADGVAA